MRICRKFCQNTVERASSFYPGGVYAGLLWLVGWVRPEPAPRGELVSGPVFGVSRRLGGQAWGELCGFLKRPVPVRHGLTLVEVLIALAITLLILLSMTQAFTVASRDIGIGRNRLLVAERVRNAGDLIRADFEKLSLNVGRVVAGAEGAGYLEIVDGPYRDQTLLNTSSSLVGDMDDVLMFTAISNGQPFSGRFDGRVVESHEAEIIYFTRWVDSNLSGARDFGDQIRLYRRVLLVRPDLTNMVETTDGTVNVIKRSIDAFDSYVLANNLDPVAMARSPYAKYLQFNDVSLCRNEDAPVVALQPPLSISIPRFRCNSLGTLSHPKNRTAHLGTTGNILGNGRLEVFGFPHPVLAQDAVVTPAIRLHNVTTADLVLLGTMAGSDVVMENVIGFDVKVFDPTVAVLQYAGQPVLPQDPGYDVAVTNPGDFPPQGFGAYVDLGAFEFRGVNGELVITNPISTATPLAFGHWRRRLVDPAYAPFIAEQPRAGYWDALMTSYETFAGGPTYSTWTTAFESDGVDTDGDGFIDEGADGIPQGNAVSGIRNDRDSAPPYSHPVKSVQITLRAASYDADRQQIRGSDQVMQTQIVVSTNSR